MLSDYKHKNSLKTWLQQVTNQTITDKLSNSYGIVLLGLITIIISWVVVTKEIEYALAAFVFSIASPIVILCLFNTQIGLVIVMYASAFAFVVPRITGLYDLPVGVAPDILLFVVFLGIFIDKVNRFKTFPFFNNIVFYLLALWVAYLSIQMFNPNSLSLTARLYGIRGLLLYILIFSVLTTTLSTSRYIKIFTISWLTLAVLIALYSFYQEFVGLPFYDLIWIQRSPESIGLNFIRGRWRKWSFISDPATFGMFMSFTGLFAIVLAMGLRDVKVKVTLFLVGLICLVAMSFSGTRTAVAMTVAGIVLYGLLTIHKRSTVVLGLISASILITIIFIPYYDNATINSIRSTFNPSEDNSFNVRVVNKERIQPYMRSHPIGGGRNTTGDLGEFLAPEHPLAGFPPDSYYMNVALETGWIGLGLFLILIFTTVTVGIINYYRVDSHLAKSLYAAYITSFFALTLAGYAQESITQKPMAFVYYACFILMVQLKKVDLQDDSQSV